MHCRVCNAALRDPIFALDDMPLTDGFVPVSGAIPEYIRDIRIYKCAACGLVQNPIDFDHAGYYESYEYSSGHSEFTKRFMLGFAQSTIDAFAEGNERPPASVLEIGSGDGEQLQSFVKLRVADVLGVEPSDTLVAQSESVGIPALKGLFSAATIPQLAGRKFDICISSYTLDHVRSPLDYLQTANHLLNDGGILAFEVHDFAKICERSEWCLFEHEHTIYMDAPMACQVVQEHGFEVVSVNPLPASMVRANSLIVLARKKSGPPARPPEFVKADLTDLQGRIDETIARIDRWVVDLPAGAKLVGYGAGGRGVMTLAALAQHSRFDTIFDSNYQSGKFLTPATRIPVSGIDSLPLHSDAWCLVFSFGYLTEISKTLVDNGFDPEKIVPLNAFYGTPR